MTNETLHSVEFIEQTEYETEDHPEYVYEVSATSEIPVPRQGETITFGWFEDSDGDKQDSVHFNAMNTGDAEYTRSQDYIVESVERHYHHSRKTNDSGKVVEDRIEVGTTVIVSEQP